MYRNSKTKISVWGNQHREVAGNARHSICLWPFLLAASLFFHLCQPPGMAGDRTVNGEKKPHFFFFKTEDWRIWLSGSINGKGPLDIQFDSAAGGTIISREAATRLGIQGQALATASGSGNNPQQISVVLGAILQLGGITLPIAQMPVIPLENVNRAMGRRIDAIVGKELLARYVVGIDFDAHQFILHEPETFVYRGKGQIFPLAIEEGPILQAELVVPGRPPLPCRLLLDYPYGRTIVLNAPFVRKHNLLASARAKNSHLLSQTFQGVGGSSQAQVGRIDSLQLGPYLLKNVICSFSQAMGGTFSREDLDGILGAEILRRFHVFIDYSRRQAIFEPAHALTEPFLYDQSGLELQAKDDGLRRIEITVVQTPSPAAEADLRPGDELLSVNERPVADLSLPTIRNLLRNSSRPVTLRVERNGQPKQVQLTLRPLL
jgi:hypothetical protein